MANTAYVRLTELLPAGAMLLSADGVIRYANSALADELGIPAARLQGRALADLLAAQREALDAHLRSWLRSRQLVPAALALRRADGSVTEYRCDGGLLRSEDEGPPALVFVRFEAKTRGVAQFLALNERIEQLTREVARWKRAEHDREELLERAQAARRHAEQASRIKDQLLSTVSHELRTPLTPILSWAQMLRTRKLDEGTVVRGLETIERAARSQAQLIDDLLDVSRITSGRVRLDVRRIDLPPVIEAAVESMRAAADAKGVTLRAVLDPHAGIVSADAERMQQVAWILLSNAVKFTPKGGRVDVLLQRVESSVELTVTDTGQGIDADFLPYVFESFQQASAGTTRRHAGLGLGLTIVRHMVELHGGTVRCESPGEDLGSTFAVRLPLAVTQSAPPPRDVHPVIEVTLPGALPVTLAALSILVVDDEPDTLETLAAILGAAGAQVRTAASAAAALDVLRSWRPDLLLADIGMPEQDGYALIGMVRQLPPEDGGRIPALALTAYTRKQDRIRALSAGFQMHVAKPVEPAELVAVVTSLAGWRSGV